ncbi:rod shape-determining protein MreC [Desulfobacca acetoxidans]|uniref:Cell shape-determining protein MreC n=1 Tax=Desulfobacca acetoxidans (strain ATCC 700848 / DSM 11109 / ASRB2) TaxID=880072 RepID=F2NHB9_DESAR|nr:rod shape-determining protein MreC [Desulfobacca acetoxidans]AEB09035.1 rod shape-determining protein MreC [Desulfobacca acetoxidans DSM 11109]
MNKKTGLHLWRRFQAPIIFGLSVFLIFVLISASLRDPHPLRPLENLVVNLTAPVFDLLTRTGEALSRVWHGYFYLVDVQAENDRLREKLAQGQSQETLYREALSEQERLRKLLEFKTQAALPVTGARVIGFDFSVWFKCAFLDKGEKDGITWGMPVINAAGVVGRVVECYPNYAKILLLMDRSCAVDALVQRNRLRGILAGTGGNRCLLRYVEKKQDVQVGDAILASGLGGAYPRGMLLGRVAAIDKKVPGIFQEIEVDPAVDFTRLDEVLLVKTVQSVLSKP